MQVKTLKEEIENVIAALQKKEEEFKKEQDRKDKEEEERMDKEFEQMVIDENIKNKREKAIQRIIFFTIYNILKGIKHIRDCLINFTR